MVDAVVRTRRVGKIRPVNRLRFTCQNCGGHWRVKEDAVECCKVKRCTRTTDCPALSHYGDCESLPHSIFTIPVTNLTQGCACQGGWICPACANVLRNRDEQIPNDRSTLAQKVLREIEDIKTVWITSKRTDSMVAADIITAALLELFQREGVDVDR